MSLLAASVVLLGSSYAQVLPDPEAECLPPYCLGIGAVDEAVAADTAAALLAVVEDLNIEKWIGWLGIRFFICKLGIILLVW